MPAGENSRTLLSCGRRDAPAHLRQGSRTREAESGKRHGDRREEGRHRRAQFSCDQQHPGVTNNHRKPAFRSAGWAGTSRCRQGETRARSYHAGAGTRPPTYGKEAERAKLKAESATTTAAKRTDTAAEKTACSIEAMRNGEACEACPYVRSALCPSLPRRSVAAFSCRYPTLTLNAVAPSRERSSFVRRTGVPPDPSRSDVPPRKG